MSRPGPPALARIGAWIVAGVCLAYAPLAGSYFFGFPSADGSLWTQVQAILGTEDLSYGARSIHVIQHPLYEAHLPWMRLHTVFGALCLVSMLPQLSTRLRLARPTLHRWTGRVAVAFGAASMVGALGFLLAVPLRELYSGATFGVGLWSLFVFTSAALAMGFLHIRRGQIQEHQSWMVLAFGFLLTAPFLRVLWVAAARMDPAMHDAWDNNLASAFGGPA